MTGGMQSIRKGKGIVSNSHEVFSRPDKMQRSSSGEEILSQQDKSQQSSSDDELPEDLVQQILSLLPVKSLRRFNCVCKSWCNLFLDSHFVKLHLINFTKTNGLRYVIHQNDPQERRFVLDYATLIRGKEVIEVESMGDSYLYGPRREASRIPASRKIESKTFLRWLWGCCKGLLCYLATPTRLTLANPSTGERKNIFYSYYKAKRHRFEDEILGGGFGYDIVNDDYKVVRINPNILSFYVYSLKKDVWNRKGRFPFKHTRIRGSASRYVNGAIHWITENQPPTIVAFDLTKEEFMEIPSPNPTPHELDAFYDLNSDGNYLCLTYCSQDPAMERYGIWIMEAYGVKESWKHISLMLDEPISRFEPLTLLNFLNSEEVLFCLDERFLLLNRIDKSLRWLTCKETSVEGELRFSYCYSYVESLISLDSSSWMVKGLKKLEGKRKKKD